MTAARTADVVVAGGGIVGLCIALALGREGVSTVLLERDGLGSGVTSASLACISAHMIHLDEIGMLKRALVLWQQLEDEVGGFEFHRCGQVRFLTRERELPAVQRWVDAERAAGLDIRLLGPAEVREVEPALTGPVVAASWSPADATVNPFLAVRRLRAAAMAAGVTIIEGEPVREIAATGDRRFAVATPNHAFAAAAVVLAAGPWTARLATPLGVALPIAARQAQALATVRLPPVIRGVVGSCETDGGVEDGYTQIQQTGAGQVLFNTVIGGQIGEDGAQDRRADPSRRFIHDSVETLVRLFPSLAGACVLRSWSRFESVSPDGRFLAGETGHPGLFVAAGCNGSGFLRAPMLGEVIRDAVLGRPRAAGADLYDPARFGAAA